MQRELDRNARSLLTAVLGNWQFTARQRQAKSPTLSQKQLELSFQATEMARLA
jgi:hypothetical protein